jgi:hypothetical protein
MARSRTGANGGGSDGAGPSRPLVGVVGGSRSDFPILEKAVELLTRFDVPAELRVVSAHRTPDHLARYAETAARRGAARLTYRECLRPRQRCR